MASSGGFAFSPAGSGWTFTGDSGIQSNGGFLAQNDPSLPNAPDGTQTAFIESYPGTSTGSVSQSVNFPNAGTYSISFLASGWRGSSEPLQLIVDSVAIPGIFTPPADSYSPFMTADFTITAPGSHTITLAGTSTGDFKVSLVDKVTITHYLVTATSTVPDPTWDPAHPRFFSGTNCASTVTALAITGHVTHVQLLVGGILVKEYDDTATTPLTTDPSVILSTGTNLTSTNLTVNFDSTHFADSTSIPIQMNVQDSGGTADNYSYQIAANGYNRAPAYGNDTQDIGSLDQGRLRAGYASVEFNASNYSSFQYMTARKQDILNDLPLYSGFYIYSHGSDIVPTVPSGIDFSSVIGDCQCHMDSSFDYVAFAVDDPTGSDSITTDVGKKSSNQPPYNFVFIDGCEVAQNGLMAKAFGIIPTSMDQACIGWTTQLEDDRHNTDWVYQLLMGMANGHAFSESRSDANNIFGKPHYKYQGIFQEAVPYAWGDPNMKLHGVYGVSGIQWFK